jgi:uncharacterized peroxidase-related enzyme
MCDVRATWPAAPSGTVAVSIINGCRYCSSVHAEVRRVDQRPEVASVRRGTGHTARPRSAIVDFAARLTREPQAVTAADLRPLREVGMDDLQIHDLIHAVAMFANANRLMQTLGEPST